MQNNSHFRAFDSKDGMTSYDHRRGDGTRAEINGMRPAPALAIIGGSGHISEIFIKGLLDLGISIRLLARNAELVQKKYPAATVAPGSMMKRDDVASALVGVDAALLITPIAPRNNTRWEVEAARPTIEAARTCGLRHLIFISCVSIENPKGVALLDAKFEIEKLLDKSRVPWSSIRCGSYMEDVIDTRKKLLDKGWFVLPVRPDLKFSYTAQKDIPRFIQKLLGEDIVLNGPIDFIAPKTFSPSEVAGLMSRISGRKIRPTGKIPLLWFLKMARPIFFLKNHRMSTITHLIEFFNKQGYTGDDSQMAMRFPDFKMTGLEEHLRSLLA